MKTWHARIIRFIPAWIRRKVPRKVGLLVTRWLSQSGTPPRPIVGIWSPQANIQPTKQALVSYITTPFTMSNKDPRNFQFSNTGIARSIVRVLNDLGYVVDVIEWTDTTFVPEKEYDLFIGHGGRNFDHLAGHLSPSTARIYFSTGLYWQEHNRREEERFRWLEERRRVRLPRDRWIEHNEESANRWADGIICLGSQIVKDSYSKFPLVINLNNAAYHDDRYDHTKKDFASGRSNFLFFSGGGNVHKGLDLLLEAFAQADAHLYICQDISSDFHKVYRHELEDCPNIHLVGFVPLRSAKFYGLVDHCNYAISLSCSEGSPGGLIECIHQGLIPVVSHDMTLGIGPLEVTTDARSIDKLVATIRDLRQRDTDWCRMTSQRVRNVALSEFSEQSFLSNMRIAVERVIDGKAR